MTAAPTPHVPRLAIRPDAWLDARLALWIAAPRLLVVADLHWGYAESHRARGNLLPAWGDADIAARLTALSNDYQPAEMIWLGDSLHTLDGRAAAEKFLRHATVPVTILSGNHDARWPRARNRAHLQRDTYFFHHGDRSFEVPSDCIEVIGHHHPAFSWHDGAGAHLKLPALVATAHRLILPAFSPWAAGTPWRNTSPDETVYAVGTKRIFTVTAGLHQKQPFAS